MFYDRVLATVNYSGRAYLPIKIIPFVLLSIIINVNGWSALKIFGFGIDPPAEPVIIAIIVAAAASVFSSSILMYALWFTLFIINGSSVVIPEKSASGLKALSSPSFFSGSIKE
jgi:hypothetical protein